MYLIGKLDEAILDHQTLIPNVSCVTLRKWTVKRLMHFGTKTSNCSECYALITSNNFETVCSTCTTRLNRRHDASWFSTLADTLAANAGYKITQDLLNRNPNVKAFMDAPDMSL